MNLSQIDEYIEGLEKLIPTIKASAEGIMEYSPVKEVTANIFIVSLEAQLEFAYAVREAFRDMHEKLEQGQ